MKWVNLSEIFRPTALASFPMLLPDEIELYISVVKTRAQN